MQAESHPFPILHQRSTEGAGIYVGPSYWREVDAVHMMSMVGLVALAAQSRVAIGINPVLNDAKISRSRNRAASAFLESPADIFLCLDGDVEFEPFQIFRMCEMAYEHGMVGGAYVKRSGHTPDLAIRLLTDSERIEFHEDGKLVEVDYLNTGCIAIHRKVFEAIIAQTGMEQSHQSNMRFYPFFNDYIVEKHGGERFDLSEDWAFVQRAKDAGFKPMLDPRVRLRHWGLYDFTLEDSVRPPREEPGLIVWEKQGGKERTGYAAVPLVVSTKDGFKMHLMHKDNSVSKAVRETGIWEPPVRDAVLKYLEPDWTFLDLGANIGYFSLLAASRGNHVIAVEPNPEALKYFKQSIAENHFEELIDLREVAVSSSTQKLTLVTQGLRNQGEAYLTLPNPQAGELVQATTLDQLLGANTPEFIKMDIEGEEWNVIMASPECFLSAKVVLFEVSDEQLKRNSQVGANDILHWFESHGFALEQLSSHGTYADWIATKL
jgi:FkbM family methyltransferase